LLIGDIKSKFKSKKHGSIMDFGILNPDFDQLLCQYNRQKHQSSTSLYDKQVE